MARKMLEGVTVRLDRPHFYMSLAEDESAHTIEIASYDPVQYVEVAGYTCTTGGDVHDDKKDRAERSHACSS